MSKLVIVCQEASSSGLPQYLARAFQQAGHRFAFADAHAGLWQRLRSLSRSWAFSKHRWHRRREMLDYYSLRAFRRNTQRNGTLLDQALEPGAKVLQIGGLYHPHPRFRDMEYYLFFTYTMRLALRDGYSPWIVQPHEEEPFLELESELYRCATHIFVAASFVKQSLIDGYGVSPERISVVGMGVDDFYLDNMEVEPTEDLRRICLFVGYTFELKGGPDVLRAFQLARQEVPDLQLRIVGPRRSPHLRAPGVTALGPVHDKKALLEYYREADLLLVPSRCDSFGFVFLEAMTQGVVCIGGDLNAMPEIIKDGETGFLVKPGDHRRMAELIAALYKDPQRKKEMGERARARVKAHFTWPRVTQAMAEIMGMDWKDARAVQSPLWGSQSPSRQAARTD